MSEERLAALPGVAVQRKIGFRWIILALVCVGTTINYIDRLVIAILAPELQKRYGISDIEYGRIGAAFGLAYAFGQLGAGAMLDTLGTRFTYGAAVLFWSIWGMLTALGRGALSFGVLRAMLGICESPGYPAAAKVCAEWFPRRQRALAFGFVNAGCNMAAIVAAVLVPWLTLTFSWQWAFIGTGLLGLVLLLAWWPLYGPPQGHPRVSAEELSLILSDPPEPATRLRWREALRHRQAWVFVAGKFLTDAMWWFYITWAPKFLSDKPYNLPLKDIGLPLVVIYLMADFGSVGGGWLSSFMIDRGVSVNMARKSAMLACAVFALPMMFVPSVSGVWAAVGILGMATAAHQGFSSNNYTLCSDLFPKSMVGAMSGLGGAFGWAGASLFQEFTGEWVQHTGNYFGPFFCASITYVVSLAAIHLVSPRLEPLKE